MTTHEGTPVEGAQALRSELRADLVTAMKARRPDVVTALRTAISAIDNAEAVEAPRGAGAAAGEHVAGARIGVGSTEVERRTLSVDDVRAVLRAQIEECIVAADRCDAQQQHEVAGRLRREAEVLGTYVDE